jgi:hypothetical protein
MFLILVTLQRKITLNVSDHGYLTEETLHWMFLIMGLNIVVSKGHPITVGGIGIVTESMGQIIWKSEDYCHVSEALLPPSSG